MKKYLITGVSGFVAWHFLNYLDALGMDIEVLGLDKNFPQSNTDYKFRNIKIRFVQIDMLDYKALEIALVSFAPEYLVHLASFSSVGKSWQEPINSISNNTNIFLNIAEIIRRNNIKCKILSVGSSEEYGNVPEISLPLKEDQTLNPVSPYAIARVSQEMLSRCYVSTFKLDIVLTRSFNHIGPRQRETFVVSSFVKQILEGTKKGCRVVELSAGDVSIVRDFVDVRDVAAAYYLLLENGRSGELYNICSGTGKSLHDIINIIAGLLDVDVKINVDNSKIRPNDNKKIIGDYSKIKSLTGWEPRISLKQSLRDIIDYWKERCGIGVKNIQNYIEDIEYEKH